MVPGGMPVSSFVLREHIAPNQQGLAVPVTEFGHFLKLLQIQLVRRGFLGDGRLRGFLGLVHPHAEKRTRENIGQLLDSSGQQGSNFRIARVEFAPVAKRAQVRVALLAKQVVQMAVKLHAWYYVDMTLTRISHDAAHSSCENRASSLRTE